eukprot:GHVS01061441.1.p1 GENE.GHVS01061441.1~~GHVS01061441.1.p1  ORF type:complete len:140 (-),score=10.11 GHVS01061441.1:315-734(-)
MLNGLAHLLLDVEVAPIALQHPIGLRLPHPSVDCSVEESQVQPSVDRPNTTANRMPLTPSMLNPTMRSRLTSESSKSPLFDQPPSNASLCSFGCWRCLKVICRILKRSRLCLAHSRTAVLIGGCRQKSCLEAPKKYPVV